VPGFATHKINLKEIAPEPITHKTKIIEIIGPPGIGKSTFYQALCKSWSTRSNWVYQNKLLAPSKPKLAEFNAWLRYEARTFLHKNETKDIPVDYGLRFVDRHKELAQFFWDRLSGIQLCMGEEIDKCFRSAYFLFKDFCRYQAIAESSCSKPCMIDEGFLQKSFLIHNDEKFMTDIVNEYILLLPLPYSVIYINTTDVNIIVERICNRKKIIASHFGKDATALIANTEKWQQLFKIIIEKLRLNNIPVYCIDGEKPIEENVRFINAVLN